MHINNTTLEPSDVAVSEDDVEIKSATDLAVKFEREQLVLMARAVEFKPGTKMSKTTIADKIYPILVNNLSASRAEKVAAIASVTPVGRKTNIVRTRLNKWKLQHVDGLNETGMPPQCIIMARALNVLAENQTEIDVAGINEMLLNSGLVTRQEPIRIFKYYVHDLESTGILISQNVPAKPKSKVDPAELTDTDETEVPNAELDQAFADKI